MHVCKKDNAVWLSGFCFRYFLVKNHQSLLYKPHNKLRGRSFYACANTHASKNAYAHSDAAIKASICYVQVNLRAMISHASAQTPRLKPVLVYLSALITHASIHCTSTEARTCVCVYISEHHSLSLTLKRSDYSPYLCMRTHQRASLTLASTTEACACVFIYIGVHW
jgi:predicted RNA-binding protein YlxR (DUF448 family)